MAAAHSSLERSLFVAEMTSNQLFKGSWQSRKKCKPKDILIRKYLDSAEIKLGRYESSVGVGQITETLLGYLVEEVVNVERDATSTGYPARSIYKKRPQAYARKLSKGR